MDVYGVDKYAQKSSGFSLPGCKKINPPQLYQPNQPFEIASYFPFRNNINCMRMTVCTESTL